MPRLEHCSKHLRSIVDAVRDAEECWPVMFNAITGALSSSGKAQSLRMRSITGKSEDTIEHKNKIIDALTAELTQKVINRRLVRASNDLC